MASPRRSVGLATPRLLLREFELSDAAAIQSYAGDPEVARFTSWGPNTVADTAAVLAAWLEEQQRSPRIEWPIAIVRKSDSALIGGTGFGQVDWQAGTAVFGYVLERAAWGFGYATEAGSAVVDWALGELGLRQLTAHCEPTHAASLNVLRKLGFRQEPDLVEQQRTNGEIRSYLTFVKSRL
jgi:RimJ/RimL family protein N-acetyltransferase